jgi:hypothetical protein
VASEFCAFFTVPEICDGSSVKAFNSPAATGAPRTRVEQILEERASATIDLIQSRGGSEQLVSLLRNAVAGTPEGDRL